jgi:predicted permease
MNSLWQDLKFGGRLLLKNRAFTAVAVLTLALGIGANATVFTIVNAVLFKGLPIDDPDRVVVIMGTSSARNQPQTGVSYPDFLDWRAQSKSFKELAAFQFSMANVAEPGLATETFPQGRMSSNTFSLLGVKPLLGRDFRPDEDQGAGANVAIIGYDMWQRRYGGDPKVLGRIIRVNEVPHTIIGIMPAGMKFPYDQEMWTPLFVTGPASSLNRRDGRTSLVAGRLADGVTMVQAQTEMTLIAKRLEQAYPKEDKGIGARVGPFNTMFMPDSIRLLFLALLGAVGFVLLIACANVANLLLSRSIVRAREVSIRAALGAGRGRIVRQLLTESLLLAVLGTLGGLLFSIWGLRAFTAAAAEQQLPYWMTFTMDRIVFVYLAAVCVATSVLFGLAPALHASNVDLSQTLKEGARGSGSGRARTLSRALVVAEVALALVLLIGAGLMIRSFQTLMAMSASLEKDNVLTMTVPLMGSKYIVREPRVAFLERLEPELVNTPGVDAVAVASTLPLGWGMQTHFDLEGQDAPADPNQRPGVASVEISSQYFDILGVPIMRGRAFTAIDGRQGEKVAIVNRRFAAKYWPGQDPIGKRIGMMKESPWEPTHQLWVTVVGEVADIKQNSGFNSNQGEMEPVIYVPYLQEQDARQVAILARAKGDPHALADPLRKAVQRVNSDIPVTRVLTLPEHFAKARWFMRLFGSLFAIFAGIGALLAAVGIYAMVAYSVGQRTQEIGIRSALGAQRGAILRLIVGQGVKLAVVGLVVGLAAAFAVTRVMRSFLIGVTPTDPATIVAVTVLLTAVAALASYVPARRAAALDPVRALRAE